MAESDQIRDKDLFQPDITAKFIADLKLAEEQLNSFEAAIKRTSTQSAKSLAGMGTPGNVDDLKKYNELIDQQKTLETGLTEVQKKQVEVQLQLTQAKQKYRSDLKAETSSYAALNNELGIARQKAKDLAATYGIHSKEAAEAVKQTQLLDTKIKAIDATLGLHQRNVGNYSGALVKLQRGLGGLAGLGATIAQVFGVDTTQVQFLIDASHELIKTSKELTHTNELGELAHEKLAASQTAEAAATTTNTAAAEAQTAANEELTTSTEAQTVANEALEASNPFGWIALAIAGIAALSIGIYEWTKTETDAEIATKGLQDTVSDFNTGASTAIEKVDKMKAVFQEAKDGVISKDKALKDYNDTLGGTLGYAKDLNQAEQIMLDKVPAYIKAQGLKAQADALFKKAADAQAEAITASQSDQISFWDKITSGINVAYDAVKNLGDVQKTASDAMKIIAVDQSAGVAKVKKEKNEEADVYTKLATAMLEQADALDQANGITEDKTIPITKAVTQALSDQDDALQKLLSDWEDARNSPIQSTLGALDEQTGDDIRKQLKDNLDEYKNNEDAKLDYLKVDLDKGLISQKDYDQKVYEAKKAALQQQINELLPLMQELDPTSVYYNPEIAAKFTSEQTSEIKKDYADLLAELGDLNAGYADNAKATFKSVFSDMMDGMKEVIKSFETLNKNKYDALDKELQREATLINDQTKVQEDLFKDGFDNTLSYQQKKLAENYEQQAKIAKKKHKQEEADQLAEVFLELLKANPNNPGKALAETLIAKSISLAISGSYKEGTADTGGNGSGVDGEGGMYAVLHPHEAVIPADKNAAMPGLAQAWIDGEVDDYFRDIYLPLRASSLQREDTQGARQSTDYKLMLMLNNRLTSIEKTIKEKPETDLIGYHRKYDEMVFQRKERGITQEIHFKPRGK